MDNNILVCIVSKFPYDKGETFLETEVQYYKKFQKVYLYIMDYEKSLELSKKRKLPENVEIIKRKKNNIDIEKKWNKYFYREFLREYIYILLHFDLKSTNDIMKEMYLFYNKSLECVKQIKSFLDYENINRYNKIVFYSYWMKEHALTAAFLKKIYKNATAITRCHGYDLYKNRTENDYQPFRYSIFKNLDYICPISKDGLIYLKRNWKIKNSKIRIFRLGTLNETSTARYTHRSNTKEMLIVSCSSIIKLKRVERIVEVLSQIQDINIVWYHFGDGNCMGKIREMIKVLPSNIKCNLCGHIDNGKVIDFYNEYQPDIFIHLSENEGIPVAIMEACSAGIPVIATDVGGVREIIKDGYNGYLVNKNFKNAEVIELIKQYKQILDRGENIFSKNAKSVWKKRFNADKNYSKFISFLLKGKI